MGGHVKQPRRLWWKRTDDGVTLEVRYGARVVCTKSFQDVDEARAAFRELIARHKVDEVREQR